MKLNRSSAGAMPYRAVSRRAGKFYWMRADGCALRRPARMVPSLDAKASRATLAYLVGDSRHAAREGRTDVACVGNSIRISKDARAVVGAVPLGHDLAAEA